MLNSSIIQCSYYEVATIKIASWTTEFLNFDIVDILDQVIFAMGVGLGIVACLAVSLASAN